MGVLLPNWRGGACDCCKSCPYASTTNTSNTARHIYILDGYTDNDYYHFNWGWSGQGNGWFTLDNMVPDNTSNYSNSHKAYYIIPDATTYTVTATVNDSNMGTVSINGQCIVEDFMAGCMKVPQIQSIIMKNFLPLNSD